MLADQSVIAKSEKPRSTNVKLSELITKLSEIQARHGGDLPVTGCVSDAEVYSVKVLDESGAEWEPNRNETATEVFLES